MPIIEFLRDEELKGKCIEILRQYFLSQLYCSKSGVAGDPHGTEFAADISEIRRITEIKVNHGINVDGLELFYEHYGPPRGYVVGEHKHKVGRWRGEHTDTITLNKDEEIKTIETGIN